MFSLEQYETLRTGAGVFRRVDRGRIILRGDDRRSYLHGLLSNDILSLTPGNSCYATLLTAQGRMISDMRVFELGDRVLIDLEADVTPAVREHFDRFVITEDVIVEDATGTLAQIGVYGPHGHAVATMGAPGGAPVLSSADLGVAGVDLFVPPPEADGVVRRLLEEGAREVDRDVLEVTRVEAGIPRFLVDMDTSTIPLEAGIEGRAISMTKGCYVGQEVIVRVLHRGGGRVAKKLVGLRAPAPLQRGDAIVTEERELGHITSAVTSPRFGPIALGYVHRDFIEPGTQLRVRSNGSEVPVEVTVLPFQL